MGGREILETYLNSGSKNTSEIDIFPHGPKSLLTNVICIGDGCLQIFITLVFYFQSMESPSFN